VWSCEHGCKFNGSGISYDTAGQLQSHYRGTGTSVTVSTRNNHSAAEFEAALRASSTRIQQADDFNSKNVPDQSKKFEFSDNKKYVNMLSEIERQIKELSISPWLERRLNFSAAGGAYPMPHRGSIVILRAGRFLVYGYDPIREMHMLLRSKGR
jgi:hypothetical protein